VVADIGGASTEVIVAGDGQVSVARSLPIGSGRFTDRFVRDDPPSLAQLTRCRHEAKAAVAGEPALASIPAGDDIRLILVGGTGEYLGVLVGGNEAMTVADIGPVLDRMTRLPAGVLASELSVAEARARVLPAGGGDRGRGWPIWSDPARSWWPAAASGRGCFLRGSGLRLPPARRDAMASSDKKGRRGRKRGGVRSARAGGKQQGGRREGHGTEPSGEFVDAMRTLIGERWAAVWKTIPVALAGEDIEGVHDVRVASRRLRAAMDVAVECFPAGWYRPLHKSAKEITGALGEVRDRDVLLVALQEQRTAAIRAGTTGD
jgi:hypothetical protein